LMTEIDAVTVPPDQAGTGSQEPIVSCGQSARQHVSTEIRKKAAVFQYDVAERKWGVGLGAGKQVGSSMVGPWMQAGDGFGSSGKDL